MDTERQDKLDAKYSAVFNPAAFIGVKKEDFKKQYKGKIPFDLNYAWDWIVKNRGSNSKKSD